MKRNSPGQEKAARILKAQKFGVLATAGEKSPYTSLVGCAVSPDLKQLVFATLRDTSKFRNMRGNPYVALLFDDRKNRGDDLDKASALTVLGRARETHKAERENLLRIFLKRHPRLAGFCTEPGCALIAVKVKKYILTRRFQETSAWCP